MTPSTWTPIRFSSILFPTDFGPGSEAAFAHALRAALRHRARLTLLHVGRNNDRPDWTEFPGVRDMLERWGLLHPGSSREAVFEHLGIQAEKVSLRGRGVVHSIVHFMAEHGVDLLVLATAGREGIDRFFKGSVAEPLSAEAVVTTLFVPNGSRGCVSVEDGSVTMDRVLVPVAHKPDPSPGIDAAMNVIDGFGGQGTKLTLFHVGAPSDMPGIEIAEDERWDVERVCRPGEVSHEIVMAADDYLANLVCMTTEGRRGFLDAMNGTMTERVIRRINCPVLSVPAE
jgi:nucleotide-binding universal stress UspA family protein